MPPAAALFAFVAHAVLWSFDPAVSGYGLDGIIRSTVIGLFVGTASAAVFWLVASTGATISIAPESHG